MENTQVNYDKLNLLKRRRDESLYGWTIWEPTDIHSHCIPNEHKIARRVRHFTIINESLKKHRFNPDTTKVYYAQRFDETCGPFLRNTTSRLMLLELVNEEVIHGALNIKSVRGFYIPEHGRWFEFDMTNVPIYDAVKPYLTSQNQKAEFLKDLNNQIGAGLSFSLQESGQFNVRIDKIIDADFEITANQSQGWQTFIHNYFRFFFDNVKGRHGHFWVCESPEEALNVLWLATYVEGKEEHDYSENGTYDGLKRNDEGKIEFVIKPKDGEQPTEVETSSMEMKQLTLAFADGKFQARSSAFLIFKDSLFSTSVVLMDEGLVKLEDEQLVIEGINPFQMERDYENLMNV